MKIQRSIIHYSLFTALIGMVTLTSDAAVRVNNSSRNNYAAAYQQINAMRDQDTTTARMPQSEPMMGTVSGATNMANTQNVPTATNTNDDVDTNNAEHAAKMEQCVMIYPNGEFLWDVPMLGVGAGGADTCVAVIELRGFQAGENGQDLVLARANLAAGDSVQCNISSFPEATMIPSAVENFVFPADKSPTMDDVIAQMNQEQKQNAGMKIAAGALIGGLSGNIMGKNDSGSEALLGTDKGKIQGTVIGALSGAALMAGSSYAGKVAGDTILHTGVNAAVGSVAGNMAATNGSVLRIEDCELPTGKETCLWGALVVSQPITGSAFYNIQTGETYLCSNEYDTNCEREQLVSIVLEAFPDKTVDELDAVEIETSVQSDPSKMFFISVNNGVTSFVSSTGAVRKDGDDTNNNAGDVNQGIFARIQSAGTIDRQIPAMLPIRDKAFGMTTDDWNEWKQSNSGITIYGRSGDGVGYVLPNGTDVSLKNFYPMKIDATDGSMIDFSNKARLKSTMIGAGLGGALGGFAGYQGAQSDVQNRWVTAVREYEDSLSKVYCATGSRYLGAYNDMITIPAASTLTTPQTE